MEYFKADYFNEMLKKCKLNQGKMAELTGISRVTLSSYQNGKTQPTLETIFHFARILNVPFVSLIKDPLVGNDVKFDLQNKKTTRPLENFIVKIMKKHCKACDGFSKTAESNETYVILSQDEQQLVDRIRKSHGPDFEAGRQDEAEANSDSIAKKHIRNLHGQSEVG